MSLKALNLDDRDFQTLVEDALRRIRETCPEWTDLSAHDPGRVLLELFAFLTETMIYRLNRLPEKAYIEFLRLLGVKLHPPTAAGVAVVFKLNKAQAKPVEIPRGTRISFNRTSTETEAPIFTVLKTSVISSGETSTEVTAHNCELIEAELIGRGTGLNGLSVAVLRPPIVARTSPDLELIVGVEATPAELSERPRTIEHEGKVFRIWEEVENFSNLGDRRFVYVADRAAGTINFAPAVQQQNADKELSVVAAALAEKVLENREIRTWYCRGGGASGNVAADRLTILKTPLSVLATVTNPAAATGGREIESLENAILRAPGEFHSLERAVTANDVELLALRSSGAIARAKAYTKAAFWRHAAPGAIEVLLVPNVSEELRARGRITLEDLQARATEEARKTVKLELDERRPLGTTCLVIWARYKKASVRARVVAHRGADAASVKNRVLKRLYQNINPLPVANSPGWGFGKPLRVSHIYDIILAEKDVSYVETVTLHVDEVPEANLNRNSLAADAFQPDTWYAAIKSDLFRSMDNGDGWELIANFENEQVTAVQANRNKAGLLAVATKLENGGSRLYVTNDCGETWRMSAETNFVINETAWSVRDNVQLLLLATDEGLYELLLQADATPLQVLVDADRPTLGFYAVTTSVGARGTYYVAAAARGTNGVFLSTDVGKSGTFSNIGLIGEDVRVLEIQPDGVRTFLWAGISVAGNEAGKGCVRWELQGANAPTNSTNFVEGWAGGSCHGLAFSGSHAFAASHEKGVFWLDLTKGEAAAWRAPLLECGLPIRDVERIFQPIYSLAVAPTLNKWILAGTPRGVYRSADNGTNYERCSEKEFREKVTLPESWLFCSGEHEIEVVSENEKRGN